MSQERVIRPVPAHEPPYYTVVFTSVQPEEAPGYADTAARMAELVQEVPGFLGYEHARDPDGVGITVGYFRDEESIAAWRRDLEHQEAQRRGREGWDLRYSVHIARVERSYSFERE
ncbi:antibiotic biosynthesis monooxygenase family protein [Streptomyces clavuligerus]|uniref:Antibiotic biosynthesis monooxygenase n=3 Tax=Streptomyces clavuligerus TaxID=1901 RepID=E2PVG6_STRCL|nr:antibiotic biosynthesis monooxygenase [Streptomyces clavuligerus]ANW19344.1 antibiotic biosynthesis monooxygenase [Streptomyces clavuligerus]AXU13947.1 antibiotic biosynthesis monooxygenase [Streptomyces clavuligerus]EFG07880.1 Antibiotic biosynthesis monooxygenase [Streptomyces clavuligerus]MBY6303917.1 antibiotic biosynthesis monooxygenase [Streptomyces clavuligerus]QCS06721.1 antibiotic biosynthesis monooxygenase [Streptomyces clavuligerus]